MLINSIKKKNTIFISLIFLMMGVLFLIAALALYLSQTSNLVFYKMILNIILLLTILTSIYIFVSTIMLINLLSGKRMSKIPRKWMKSSLGLIYPKTIQLSRIMGLDKDSVRAVFSDINNRLIISAGISVVPGDILILLPHCLQKSSCPHKITVDINNCKRCGLCDIDALIRLRDQYHTRLFIATGGTLARRVIKDMKPKAIIAVACERDLSSGIMDVKNIPVIGILNDRPEGPCVNTKVNLKKIEDTIRYFIGEGDS